MYWFTRQQVIQKLVKTVRMSGLVGLRFHAVPAFDTARMLIQSRQFQ